MLLKAPKGLEKPTDVEFKDFTTWIQCHNLPIVCMNPNTVRRIGETVREIEEIDTGESGNCLGQYARIRVTRDVEKPLQRCLRITSGEGNDIQTILIRYERLPEFCSAYRRVGHTVRHCNDDTVDKNKKSFGPWLKAVRTMETRRRKEGRPGNERLEHNQLVRHKGTTRGKYTKGEESSRSNQPHTRNNNIVSGMEIDRAKETTAEDGSEIEEREAEVARLITMKEGEVTGGEGGQKGSTEGGDGKGKEIIRLGDDIGGKVQGKNKGWKRRARATQVEGQHELGRDVSCGTKRKETDTVWTDQQQPLKQIKSALETGPDTGITAATARQSRREP